MFYTPDYYRNISMRLSEVLGDIGVNENLVMKRRRANLLSETISTVTERALGRQWNVYNLGSRSEGTTTIGLLADVDRLISADSLIVRQDSSERTPGKVNFLMIQNETTPPGYCLLEVLRSEVQLLGDIDNILVKDTSGRILLTNTLLDALMPEGHQRQGPSQASKPKHGVLDVDLIKSFTCRSWPKPTSVWLDELKTNTWPTAEMKRYAKTIASFVVGVGNKVSENAEFEWRISASFIERYLMFSLNITQIRCLILMKMILKTYINIDNESYISSFMCKTVLFQCIASKPSNIWKECNILNCLSLCILTLNKCISCGTCPHFIYQENNLMVGKFSAEIKHQLLERMSNLIPCYGSSLFGIRFDDLGERLQIKLHVINDVPHYIQQPDEYSTFEAGTSLLHTATHILHYCNILIRRAQDESLEKTLQSLFQIVLRLTRHYMDGDLLGKTACGLLTPLFCTSMGSIIASHNIKIYNTVSSLAHAWLEAGQDSDVASSRLKHASIMHCVGNAEKTALMLSELEERYKIEVTEPLCNCTSISHPFIKSEFGRLASHYDVERVKDAVAFCTRFIPFEINCVPHELQYEMFRSQQMDLQHRGIVEDWMDCAVVDSLPFLYFLQYKTFGNLRRPQQQQHALNKLARVVEMKYNFGHRETALNLLGQCMEQENRPEDALKFYQRSLLLRERNNAAKIHICRCLANILANLN